MYLSSIFILLIVLVEYFSRNKTSIIGFSTLDKSKALELNLLFLV